MPLNTLTGSRVRERRLALGLRQAELAREAGISASYLNLIEHDRRRISADLLQRLSRALGVDSGVLEAGAEAALAEALRTAAGEPGFEAAETDRIEEYLGRFPGWAALTAGLQTRVSQLEQAVAALNDRIAHDPHLGEAVHEVLSAVSSVRSTAGILAQTEDLEPEWRQRFHSNLFSDSERLAHGAEALVAYLEGSEQSTAVGSPEEELETWLAARDWQLAGLGAADLDTLSSVSARQHAQRLVAEADADARAMPDAGFGAARAASSDPITLARHFGVPVLAAMRRLALWPGAGVGLVICDAAGALLFRRPVPGFRPPRFGAACALWPLFSALMRPGEPVGAEIEMTGRRGERFHARAFCEIRHPGGWEGAGVRQAAMLLEPLAPGRPGPALRVGSNCRICPADDCPARREISILGAA